MLDEKEIYLEESACAEKTMNNMDELMKGTINIELETEYTGAIEKQQNHVNASLHRCRRCGDHCASVLPNPPLSLICSKCESTLRDKERVIWFCEMVAKLQHGALEKEKKDGAE